MRDGQRVALGQKAYQVLTFDRIPKRALEIDLEQTPFMGASETADELLCRCPLSMNADMMEIVRVVSMKEAEKLVAKFA